MQHDTAGISVNTEIEQERRSSSPDSLFDSPGSAHASDEEQCLMNKVVPPAPVVPAMRSAVPIPGLYLPPVQLPIELSASLVFNLKEHYFPSSQPHSNQVMLFGTSMFPPCLLELLSMLSDLLRPPALPQEIYDCLFPVDAAHRGHARQAIVNMYKPGEGITAHVDLLERYGDGILGISLGSGCAMRFRKVRQGALRRSGVEEPNEKEDEKEMREVWDIWLPERSLLVLTSEARYEWTHGIEKVEGDWVSGEHSGDTEWIERRERVSITFRWLLPGAMVVGDSE